MATPTTRQPFPSATGYALLSLFIVALSAAIRLPDLGFKPLMHDESLFAYYSHFLWVYGAMDYDPILHGPLLQQVNATVYHLFGDTDFLMRLFSALCGVGVSVLVLVGKPFRAPAVNLAGALAVAVSPTLAYYSRFCRNDMPFSFFAMLWVIGCAAYWRTGKARWAATAIIAFAFTASIKENVVFLAAISLTFAPLLAIAEAFRRRAPQAPGDRPTTPASAAPRTFPLAPAALPAEATAPKAVSATGGPDGSAEERFPDRKPPRFRLSAVFLVVNNGVLALMVVAYMALALAGWRPPLGAPALIALLALASVSLTALALGGWTLARRAWAPDGLLAPVRRRLFRDRYILGASAFTGVVLFLMVYNYWQIGRFSPVGVALQIADRLAGRSDLPIVWQKDPFLALYNAGQLGFYGIIDEAVSYWWGQHAEHRLRGPFHYYIPILATYEWPLALLALAGVATGLARTARRALATLAAVVGALIINRILALSLSGPDLDRLFHMQSFGHLTVTCLYCALLYTAVMGDLLAGRRARAFVLYWAAFTLLAISYAGEKVPWLAVHVALPLALLAGMYGVDFVRALADGLARRSTLALLAVGPLAMVSLAGGLKWSLDTGALLADGHNPIQRMVFNHTTLEAKALTDRILQTRARHSAQGRPFAVHLVGEPSWPFLWYLRDLAPGELHIRENLENTTATLVLCDPADLDRVPALRRDYAIAQLPLRAAWVPPTVSLGRRFMADADPIAWPDTPPAPRRTERRWLWRHWLWRETFPPFNPNAPTGADNYNPRAATPFVFAVRTARADGATTPSATGAPHRPTAAHPVDAHLRIFPAATDGSADRDAH